MLVPMIINLEVVLRSHEFVVDLRCLQRLCLRGHLIGVVLTYSRAASLSVGINKAVHLIVHILLMQDLLCDS